MKTHFAYIAHTKYLPPTNTRGARVSVTCNGKRKVYAFDYSVRDVHAWAFEQFLKDTGLQVAQCLESQTKGGCIFAFRGGDV